MKLTIAASIWFSTLVSANSIWARRTSDIGAEGYWSPGSFGFSITPEDEDLFVNAGRRPNRTSSATFNFAPGNLSDSDSTWTWRINISELAVPNAQGMQVVNTQWDLQWPGAGSLQSLTERAGLDGSNDQGLCLSVAEVILPSNITSRYSESDQGNCSAVLGNECAEKLRLRALGGDCAAPANILQAGIAECMDTLAVSEHAHSDPGQLINMNSTDGVPSSIQPGDAFWYHTSARVSAGNESIPYTTAETRLNFLFLREIPVEGKGTTAATMLCQVVNPSATPSGAPHVTVGGFTIWALGLAIAWILVLS